MTEKEENCTQKKMLEVKPKKKDFPTKSHLSFSDAVAQFRPIVEKVRMSFI
jgi:hypothetical protein